MFPEIKIFELRLYIWIFQQNKTKPLFMFHNAIKSNMRLKKQAEY